MLDVECICSIRIIETVEISFDNKHIIIFHIILYVTGFEVPIFRIKTNMQYDVCYQHNEGQVLPVSFSTLTYDAITADEITIKAKTIERYHFEFNS